MPQFAVFFSDGAGFGIEMVQALDAAQPEEIRRPLHRCAALAPLVDLPLGPGVAEVLTLLSGMQSC